MWHLSGNASKLRRSRAGPCKELRASRRGEASLKIPSRNTGASGFLSRAVTSRPEATALRVALLSRKAPSFSFWVRLLTKPHSGSNAQPAQLHATDGMGPIPIGNNPYSIWRSPASQARAYLSPMMAGTKPSAIMGQFYVKATEQDCRYHRLHQRNWPGGGAALRRRRCYSDTLTRLESCPFMWLTMSGDAPLEDTPPLDS